MVLETRDSLFKKAVHKESAFNEPNIALRILKQCSDLIIEEERKFNPSEFVALFVSLLRYSAGLNYTSEVFDHKKLKHGDCLQFLNMAPREFNMASYNELIKDVVWNVCIDTPALGVFGELVSITGVTFEELMESYFEQGVNK